MKTFWLILVIVVVVLGGWWWLKNQAAPAPVIDNDYFIPAFRTSATTGDGTDTGMVDNGTIATPAVKNFTVTASNFKFSPAELRVKRGETVRVTLINAAGTHDWKLDQFPGVATKILQAGQSETVEFVADKVGTFEYYCSVGTHRQMGMQGNLIVGA